MLKKQPLVAVVILNWNGRKFLEDFLPSVVASTYPNLNVVMADNGSTDDSIAFTKQHYPNVEIVVNEENYGFAGGYNEALKKVEADYYVLLNSDVEVSPNWIEPLIEKLESDPLIAACQPKVKAYHNKDYFEYAGAAGGFIDAYGYPFCRGRIFDTCELDEGQYEHSTEIFWATGAALCMRAELYHQMGGLDADFFAHMEEIDLCWRIKNAGYQIHYCPESVVYHVGGGTLQKENPRKTYLNFRNNLTMYIKNASTTDLLFRLPIRYALDVVAAYRFLLGGKRKDYWAVARSHFYFFGNLGKSFAKRKAVKSLIKEVKVASPNTKGKYDGLLIWEYYAKGKKLFSKLAISDKS